MKVLLMSDSHGLINEVNQVVDHFQAEHIIHCGDYCVDHGVEPFDRMIKVHGNCDFGIEEPLNRFLQWNGLKVLLTHGHKYRVKESLLPLSYMAEENGIQLILFGHSHFPVSLYEQGKVFINPGSIAQPRGYPEPTFVLINLVKNDHQIDLIVDFYNLQFEKKKDLGGVYKIPIKL